MQVNKKSDLYVALTLAVLIVGTVLPTPKECLEMLKCIGAGDANKFAEICCAIFSPAKATSCLQISMQMETELIRDWWPC